MEIRIAGIVEDSIVDGRGIRMAVFVQGCPHHCPGCHNPQTHDFAGGTVVDTETLLGQIKADPLLSGVTFSGGEPFCQPKPLIEMAKEIRAAGRNVMAYSGYTYEQLLTSDDPDVRELLSLCDILVDGPFVLAERDLTLRFRGSRNQRLIDVPKSLEQGEVVLYAD